MLAVLAFLGLLAAGPGPSWNAKDSALEATFAATLAGDMSTTVWAGQVCVESNPILGRCPSRTRIAEYGAGSLALHATVAAILPQPYRRFWQLTWIGIESANVGRNLHFGARFEF